MAVSATISSIPNWALNALKLLLLLAIGYLLYTQVYMHTDVDLLQSKFDEGLQQGRWYYLLICVLLMPFNWLIESQKWRMLIAAWIKIPLRKAFKGILAGLSVGIVTPARIGEYAGRLIVLPNGSKAKSLMATLMSSISQNVANLIFGFFGAIVFFYCYFPIPPYVYMAGSVIGLAALVLVMTLYLHADKWNLQQLLSWKPLHFLQQQANVLSQYDRHLLSQVLQWSLLRYIVYTIQYVLMLYFLGISIPLAAAISGVALIYLIQSGIPLPPILGVVARGELALLIWSIFTDNVAGILVATFGLWVINLVIPALFGLLIVLNVNNRKLSK